MDRNLYVSMPPTTATIIQIGRLSTDVVGESAPGAAPWSDAASDVVGGAAGVGSTSGEATDARGGGLVAGQLKTGLSEEVIRSRPASGWS